MERKEKFEQLVVRWILVVLPTLLIGVYTIRALNFSYTALTTSLISQSLWFSLGLFVAYTLYYYRARWIVTLVLLWVAYALGERIISRLPGEFDVFYTTARFQLYSTLFLFGWGFGLLLAKIRWSYILIFGVLVVATLVIAADTIDLSIEYLLVNLFPVLIYGLYMYFLSPLLRDRIEISWKQSGRLVLRLAGFLLVILLAFVITDRLLRGTVKAVEKELAARGAKGDKEGKGGEGQDKKDDYDDRYGLMDHDDDGFRLKDTMKVNTRMSQSDRLMFCAKLDNYFDNGDPQPLYFVYHYLTRYDPVKESFTRDVNVPSSDEFEVDPAELPMYYSYMDTSIIRKAKGPRLRKIVNAQVYLSADAWKHAVLGPANVFSIQTIPVEKDFQKQFLSAYRTQSYVSELNNAYFVYNVSASPMLEGFQEQRHEELREVIDYRGVDPAFYEYYTRQPTGGIYDSISKLAHSLAPKHVKPIDKVLAVRDFFLRRNENGKRIFRYTLKPGRMDDPNIPSSKMLYDFLFKTHAGYCTYYAGASLFMLRALGIPARFTTGFATVNRSDKNKGWYWFYASQAHAWTQVYFPEYGWLDFDMTIGNEDQQSAPKPDGTPPLPPPDPWLVLDAKAESLDLPAKRITVSFQSLLYLEKPYLLKNPLTRPIDVSMCRVLLNKKDTTLAVLQPGDSIIVVSYKDEAREIPVLRKGAPIDPQVAAFPSPIIADEIHIRRPEEKKKEPEKEGNSLLDEEKKKKITFEEIAWMVAKGLAGIAVLLLLAPLLYLVYRIIRQALARGTSRADEVYRSALYRLHMAGLERESETPLEYARRMVDPQLQAGFESFMLTYLRLKYSGQPMRPEDREIVDRLANTLGSSIRRKTGIAGGILNYFNLLRALRYFQQPISSPEPETHAL
ncbi:MAG: hypothetical protein JNN04_17270 [Cyclobacteriaceae bacterium]|nr:hypothetical protein [Cyclobacteriaceae bacterium]